MKAILFLALVLATAAPAISSPLALRDFAAGVPIKVVEGQALHEFILPAEAYRGVVSSLLRDIAVFNGNGEPLPYALLAPATTEKKTEIRAVPIFALPAGVEQGPTGMALQVRTDSTGAIVNLSTAPTGGKAGLPTVYIVDASRLEQPVAGLDLTMNHSSGNYLGTVQVAASDDLERWVPHAVAALAALDNGSNLLERQRVEFPLVRAKYLRLTLEPQHGPLPRFTAATARFAPATAQPPRSRMVFPAIVTKDGDYLVDTSGHLPIDRIGLVFPRENGIARVTFSSRPTPDAPWTVRRKGTVYRLLQEGKVLESPPLELSPVSDRYWLIRLDEGSPGDVPPQLEVGWVPHRVMFVSQGNGPFRLAWGSSLTELPTLRDDCLLANFQGNYADRVRPAGAVTGSPEVLGGEGALRQRVISAAWRRGLLWGSLGLGVALLAVMALRLGREMKHD